MFKHGDWLREVRREIEADREDMNPLTIDDRSTQMRPGTTFIRIAHATHDLREGESNRSFTVNAYQ